MTGPLELITSWRGEATHLRERAQNWPLGSTFSADYYSRAGAYTQCADQLEATLRTRPEAEPAAPVPLDKEPSVWDYRRAYAPGEQVWVVRFDVWHPAEIVRTDLTDYIVRILSCQGHDGQLITATPAMLRARTALAQAEAVSWDAAVNRLTLTNDGLVLTARADSTHLLATLLRDAAEKLEAGTLEFHDETCGWGLWFRAASSKETP